MSSSNLETLYDLTVKYRGQKARKKWPAAQTYVKEVYPHYFESRRQEARKVVEVGCFRGGFIRPLRDYFPNATVLGVDVIIQPEVSEPEDRIIIEQGDQRNVVRMKEIAEKHGPFDFVIDDALHSLDAQAATIEVFMPHIVSGGWFFVEDVISQHRGQRLFEYVKEEYLTYGSFVRTVYSNFPPREDFDYPYIKVVAFHPGLIAIQRA